MNPEYATLYQIAGAGIAVVIASFIYSWSGLQGSPGKWLRRFISSLILASTVNVLCLLRGIWHPWFLAVYLPITGAFSLGYGSDFTMIKIIKRTLVVLAFCMSGLIFCFTLGGNAWWVLVAHVGIGAGSIYMGVKNPIESAAEMFIVCLLLSVGLICYPFV